MNGTARTFYVDLMPPEINLTYPGYAQTFNTNNITFNWTAIDFNSSVFINCTLFVTDALGQGDRNVQGITGYSNTTFTYHCLIFQTVHIIGT